MSLILGYFIKVFPSVVALSITVYLPTYFILRKKHGKRPLIRHIAIFTFIVVVFSILYITLLGVMLIDGFVTFNPQYHHMNLVPFAWIEDIHIIGIKETVKQVLLNIIMIVPLGFILPVVFKAAKKCWKSVLYTMAFCLCIETLQYFIGRSADVDDLILNTVGGFLGYGVFAVFDKVLSNNACWRKTNDF